MEARADAAERLAPGRRVRQHRPHTEDIAGRADAVPLDLLGRHEGGRAEDRAGAGLGLVADRVQGPRDTEVDDPGAVDGEQHIGRLEVAVHQADAVDVEQRAGQPVRQPPQRVLRQRAVAAGAAVRAADDLAQRGARDIAGGDPRHRGLGVGVQHRRGPAPADPPRGRDLGTEAVPELLLDREFGLHQLHRDGPAALGTGEVDPSHPAAAETAEQPVVPDPLRIVGRQPPQAVHPGALPRLVPVPEARSGSRRPLSVGGRGSRHGRQIVTTGERSAHDGGTNGALTTALGRLPEGPFSEGPLPQPLLRYDSAFPSAKARRSLPCTISRMLGEPGRQLSVGPLRTVEGPRRTGGPAWARGAENSQR